MPHRKEVPAFLTIDVAGFDKLAQKMSESLTTISAVQDVLKDHAKILQQRAVRNVSSNLVSYKGRTFIVNRQTGKLARSIQATVPNPLAIVGIASAEYASDVEQGTRGPVDLKLTSLAGKVVPLPVTNAQGKAITAPNGKLIKKILVGAYNKKFTSTSGFKENPQVATTGSSMGSKYIMFRRVPGPGGKGWIIPQRPAKPFMEEAGDYTSKLLAEAIEQAFKHHLENDGA